MRIGILLSGSGIGDGSQIEEVMLTYLMLDKYNLDYISFAPNRSQFETFNHFEETASKSGERNILIESSRIGRGKIKSLEDFDLNEIDGLIIPGGLGVFKNLSDYVIKKDKFEVKGDVRNIIEQVYHAEKPIGAMCGGALIIGKCLESLTSSLTLGIKETSYGSYFTGSQISCIEISASNAYVDSVNKVITTPAFLKTQNLYEMMFGIEALVKGMIEI